MARKVLFLDRDGVINVDHAYVHRPAQTEWVPGIFDLVRRAQTAGYDVVVITNQAGIARGYFSEEHFIAYSRWMSEAFRLEGCPLLATYHCPHHPKEGVGIYQQDCACRKPEPGMILQAVQDWDIDLSQSCLVGDKAGDVSAGLAAGVAHNFLFLSPLYPPPADILAHPGVRVVHHLADVVLP